MTTLTPEQRDREAARLLQEAIDHEWIGGPATRTTAADDPWNAWVARAHSWGLLATAEPGEDGLRALLAFAETYDEDDHPHASDALKDRMRAALRAPVADAGLDVERLAKAMEAYYAKRPLAMNPSAKAIAAEYARLAATEEA